ncbi:MAG: ribosome biogenesis GTP-binding protein YihA/YsxC, partial [Oscillospiraceae bacterium]|nr:ribosome biogenesis GTP-binding protein YihA/YsxC [Oscillospiraceae bacterium]
MNLHNVEFVKSVANAKDILSDGLPQIVFSGKSNVGKSSVINKLLNRKQFARVSSTPGKTIHINYFLIDKKAYFVDLPGYGYAKVAKTEYNR